MLKPLITSLVERLQCNCSAKNAMRKKMKEGASIEAPSSGLKNHPTKSG
jgi:hypothetical protein